VPSANSGMTRLQYFSCAPFVRGVNHVASVNRRGPLKRRPARHSQRKRRWCISGNVHHQRASRRARPGASASGPARRPAAILWRQRADHRRGVLEEVRLIGDGSLGPVST
jgi:hypothetical protein